MDKAQLADLESQPAQQEANARRARRALKARLAHIALTALVIASFWAYSPPTTAGPTLPTRKPAALDWSHLSYTKLCPGIAPISSAEFSTRRDKLAELLRGEAGRGWGAYVTEPGPNTLYYTNLTDSDWHLSERPWLVAVSPGKDGASQMSVLTPSFEKSRSQRLPFALTKQEYAKVNWVTWEEAENPYAILVEHLDGLRAATGAKGGWRIELEENVRTFVGTGLAVAGQAVDGEQPQVGFASLAVREQRMRKTDAELDIQRCVAKVTVQALREVRTKLVLGMTELEGEALIKAALAGGGLTSLSAIVLFGANAALPHASASATKRLEAGEFALFDVGGHLLGYESDFTRTMLPDSKPAIKGAGCHSAAAAKLKNEWPSARAEKIWRTVYAAQVAALEAEVNANTLAGVVSAASVDQAARDLITAEGFGPYFTHRLGHGIGLQVHEAPYLNSGNVDQPINSGVTHSNEPGIYIEREADPEGLGIGVRLEDMVHKTKDGWELLSGSALAVSPWEW